ncbi:hypothetical protein LTR87_015180 [Friedmanniomyces endolithicus]|nr:hypothetical protein LTR87_015180 [Friedmanniomyces endolithicus]
MRHFPELSDLVASYPRKDNGSPRPPKAGYLKSRQRGFNVLASGLGFHCASMDIGSDNEEILPDLPIAPHNAPTSTDLLDVPLKARCNRPFERSFQSNRKHLFTDCIFAADAERLEYVTTFGIAKDIVQSFWGYTDRPVSAPAPTSSITPLSAPETDIDMPTIENDPVDADVWFSESNPSQATDAIARVEPDGLNDGDPLPAAVEDGFAHDAQVHRPPAALHDENAASNTTTPHLAIYQQSSGVGKKRAKPTSDDAETDHLLARAERVTLARKALIGKPGNWCVVDIEDTCHVGHDEAYLEATLRQTLAPDRALHVVQGLQWRVLVPKAAEIESRRGSSIFMITTKGTARKQLLSPLAIQGPAPRLRQPWRKIRVDSPLRNGQECTVGIEAIGNGGCRLVLQDHQELEVAAVELSIEVDSQLNRSYGLHRQSNDRIVVTIGDVEFVHYHYPHTPKAGD